MSIPSLLHVLDHSKAKGSHKLVLVEIANACNKTDGLAWVSFTTIANRSGISRRQVIRLVADLIATGELEEHPGKGPRGLTAYRIPTGDTMSPVKELTGDKSDTRLVTNSTTVSCIEPIISETGKERWLTPEEAMAIGLTKGTRLYRKAIGELGPTE
jgi:helix-turn-helix protein